MELLVNPCTKKRAQIACVLAREFNLLADNKNGWFRFFLYHTQRTIGNEIWCNGAGVSLPRIEFQDALALKETVIPVDGKYGNKRSLIDQHQCGPSGLASYSHYDSHIMYNQTR